MTIKRNKVFEVERLFNKLKDRQFNIKTQYKFLKLYPILEKEREMYNQQLNGIIDKFAEKDDDGNFIPTKDGNGVQIKKESYAECNNAVRELDNMEVEIPDVEFTLEELEPLCLTMGELKVIMELFVKE